MQMTNHGSLKKNAGVSILILAVTLLLISTLLVFFTTQYSSLQQKTSSNLYHNQQAFEAAQAGLEAAIPYFQVNYAAIVAAASGGFLTPYVNSSTSNVAQTNGSQYSFVFTNSTANNYQLITITSTGVSADASSTRVIHQQIEAYSVNSLIVPNITASIPGNVIMNNSASINNTSTNKNIQAGSFIEFNNTAHTTISTGTGSSSGNLGSDVQEDDASFAGESSNTIFQSVFGSTATTASIESSANYTYTNARSTNYNSQLNGVTGSLIWINQTSGTATLTNSAVVGSAAKPVILVIDGGNLELDNSVIVYGLIFVLNPSSDTNMNNSATINGAIVSTAHDLNMNNSAALNYNTTLLNNLPAVGSGGATTSYAKVPASWRDF